MSMIINILRNKISNFNKKTFVTNVKLDTYCNHCFMYKTKDYKCCKCLEFSEYGGNDEIPLCRKNYNEMICRDLKDMKIMNPCKCCLFDNEKFLKIQYRKYGNNLYTENIRGPFRNCINIE